MADITKCLNEKCDRADTCYRVLAKSDTLQSYSLFETVCNKENGYEYYIQSETNQK